jgi:hypothetical protein
VHPRADHRPNAGTPDLERPRRPAANATEEQMARQDLGEGRTADVAGAHEQETEVGVSFITSVPPHSSILHDRSAQLFVNLWYGAQPSLTN